MSPVQTLLIGLIGGGILSWLVNWIFFRKTVAKRLSIYIQNATAVLEDVDDKSVREQLAITYRGARIPDLYQLQFAVANEGQRAIRDVIEPLTLRLPPKVRILDTKLLHVEPRGRAVATEAQQDSLLIKFPLLNKGEFFVIKLLLNGNLEHNKIRFSIAADDLPPTIVPKNQVSEPRASQPTGWAAILQGVVAAAASLTLSFGFQVFVSSGSWIAPGAPGFRVFSWSNLAACLWLGVILYFAIRALNLTVTLGILGRKGRFLVPRPEPGASDYYRQRHRRLAEEQLRRSLMNEYVFLERRARAEYREPPSDDIDPDLQV